LPPELPRGVETLLVVDDEDGVRDFATRALRNHGYTVLAARNGPEAIELSDRFSSEIHMLIADRVMPKMNGYELIQQLKGRRAGIKVILISGYADDAPETASPGVGAIPFLQKPFTQETLARMIRDVLTSKALANSGRRS
jgi:two-component system, cell cycle sensor histidine kinase and response regulator CckA